MSKLEQRLFFKLLERWAKRSPTLVAKNGVLMLLPGLPYDVVITKSDLMRKKKL